MFGLKSSKKTRIRPLLILIGNSYGNLKKVAHNNNNTVLCHNCGGIFSDPFEGITIKNGYFSVEHYGGSNWRWTEIITYKYLKDKTIDFFTKKWVFLFILVIPKTSNKLFALKKILVSYHLKILIFITN